MKPWLPSAAVRLCASCCVMKEALVVTGLVSVCRSILFSWRRLERVGREGSGTKRLLVLKMWPRCVDVHRQIDWQSLSQAGLDVCSSHLGCPGSSQG
jgi:hypothetical protein